MRRSTSTSEPLDSPARTMLTYKSEKMRGCFAIASDKPLPSVTSCFRSRVISAGIPFDSRCVMLLSATVSGIPDCSRFASCCVNVASSCKLRFALLLNCARNAGGRKREQIHFLPVALAVGRRARLRRIHRDGKKPEPLDLRQRRRTVGHVEDALDQFAACAVAPCRKIPP